MKALSTNKLVNHTAYPKILMQYNERLQKDGKVNAKKFYEDIVVKEIPSYSLQSWYFFLKRFKTEAGIVAVEVVNASPGMVSDADEEEGKTQRTLMTNQEATTKLIMGMLNISADAARDILEHPEKLTYKERLEIGLKAMKAQDSRIHAVGKLREDNREQERFDRAFSDAQYG